MSVYRQTPMYWPSSACMGDSLSAFSCMDDLPPALRLPATSSKRARDELDGDHATTLPSHSGSSSAHSLHSPSDRSKRARGPSQPNSLEQLSSYSSSPPTPTPSQSTDSHPPSFSTRQSSPSPPPQSFPTIPHVSPTQSRFSTSPPPSSHFVYSPSRPSRVADRRHSASTAGPSSSSSFSSLPPQSRHSNTPRHSPLRRISTSNNHPSRFHPFSLSPPHLPPSPPPLPPTPPLLITDRNYPLSRRSDISQDTHLRTEQTHSDHPFPSHLENFLSARRPRQTASNGLLETLRRSRSINDSIPDHPPRHQIPPFSTFTNPEFDPDALYRPWDSPHPLEPPISPYSSFTSRHDVNMDEEDPYSEFSIPTSLFRQAADVGRSRSNRADSLPAFFPSNPGVRFSSIEHFYPRAPPIDDLTQNSRRSNREERVGLAQNAPFRRDLRSRSNTASSHGRTPEDAQMLESFMIPRPRSIRADTIDASRFQEAPSSSQRASSFLPTSLFRDTHSYNNDTDNGSTSSPYIDNALHRNPYRSSTSIARHRSQDSSHPHSQNGQGRLPSIRDLNFTQESDRQTVPSSEGPNPTRRTRRNGRASGLGDARTDEQSVFDMALVVEDSSDIDPQDRLQSSNSASSSNRRLQTPWVAEHAAPRRLAGLRAASANPRPRASTAAPSSGDSLYRNGFDMSLDDLSDLDIPAPTSRERERNRAGAIVPGLFRHRRAGGSQTHSRHSRNIADSVVETEETDSSLLNSVADSYVRRNALLQRYFGNLNRSQSPPSPTSPTTPTSHTPRLRLHRLNSGVEDEVEVESLLSLPHSSNDSASEQNLRDSLSAIMERETESSRSPRARASLRNRSSLLLDTSRNSEVSTGPSRLLPIEEVDTPLQPRALMTLPPPEPDFTPPPSRGPLDEAMLSQYRGGPFRAAMARTIEFNRRQNNSVDSNAQARRNIDRVQGPRPNSGVISHSQAQQIQQIRRESSSSVVNDLSSSETDTTTRPRVPRTLPRPRSGTYGMSIMDLPSDGPDQDEAPALSTRSSRQSQSNSARRELYDAISRRPRTISLDSRTNAESPVVSPVDPDIDDRLDRMRSARLFAYRRQTSLDSGHASRAQNRYWGDIEGDDPLGSTVLPRPPWLPPINTTASLSTATQSPRSWALRRPSTSHSSRRQSSLSPTRPVLSETPSPTTAGTSGGRNSIWHAMRRRVWAENARRARGTLSGDQSDSGGHPRLFRYRGRNVEVGDYVRDEDLDTSYEGLLRLTAMLGEARPKGLPESVVNGLPSGLYRDWASPGNSDARCPICLDDYDQQDPVLKVPQCAHWFHKGCIEQWFKAANTCPVCRGRVTREPNGMESRPTTAPPEPGPSRLGRRHRDDDDDDDDLSPADDDMFQRIFGLF